MHKWGVLGVFFLVIAGTIGFVTLMTVGAAQDRVIALGADLTPAGEDQVLEIFGLTRMQLAQMEIPVIEVTHAEERDLLSGLVPPETLGSKAISSVYIQLLPQGRGIRVQTHGITWVTPEIYANALVTAGIRDAQVFAAAPHPVSGTAALTGIFKAFETASGQPLSPEAKEASRRELVITGELAEEMGSESASDMVREIKVRILSEDAREPQEITQIVIEVSGEHGVQLSPVQQRQLVETMEYVSRSGLDAEILKQQVSRMGAGILGRILNFFQSIVSFFFNLLR